MQAAGRRRLLERESELAQLDAALAAAAGGRGQLVVVEAAAGLGKTRLLDAAVERARELGLTPFRARGSELEGDFAFGVVRQLLEPALSGVGSEELERLFAGAAALARPLFDRAPEEVADAPADASYRSLHGLYWLLSNLSDAGPLVLAVDDVHWADAPTLRFLAFLHARLAELAVALIISLRSGDPGAERTPLAGIVGAPDAIAVEPGPLSAGAVHELLRAALAREPDPADVAACRDVTAGNPFYLHALLAELSAPAAAGGAGLTARVRRLGPRAVSRSVLLRIAALAPTAPALARAAAVLGDGAALGDAALLARLHEDDAASLADLLTRAEILKPGSELEFVHPIVAEAIYADLAPRERAAWHARAARVLAAAEARPERVAAQLVHSEPGGDAAAVDALGRAARDASGRGAPETAITFLRRALDEPPAEELRPELLLRLGTAEFQAGRMSAAEHLQAVLESDAEPALLAQAALLLARALAFAQRPHDAIATLQRTLDAIASADRESALELEAELVATAQLDVLPGEVVAERLQRRTIADFSQGRTVGECKLLAVCAFQALRENRPATAVIALGRRALAGPSDKPPSYSLPYSLPVSLAEQALVYAEDYDFVTTWLEQMLAKARTRGALSAFAAASYMLAVVARARGDIREHEAHIEAAIDAIDAPANAMLLAVQAEAMLERGDASGAADAFAGGGMLDAPAEAVTLSELLYARGHLRAAQGDHVAALRDLLACGERLVSTGSRSPAAIAWRSSASLEHFALGDRDAARSLAAEELALARAFGAARALGIALRAAGLVEGGQPGVELLREAVAVLDPSAAQLELARALVDLGAALRRAGQRSEASASLTRGHDIARACGADALVQRALTELRATGIRPSRRLATGLEALTPSEHRIVRMAADGLSNPQIAQALFVSKKTIETHLGHAYQKLGVRSRSQLPGVLRGEPEGD